MKWFFAINEAGSADHIGTQAKMAVVSARKNTSLRPHLLYEGRRNDFTRWMEDQGVDVTDVEVPFASYIEEMDRKGRYSKAFSGHWLRSSICNIERDEPYVLYTDCDVVFCRDPDLSGIRPAVFACAPEFRADNWNYINSGVMVMNTEGLRKDYGAFEGFIREAIAEKGNLIRDQYAYNVFYRGRWDRLPVELNWKPYWGPNPEAPIMHFHGPKIGAIEMILDGTWPWSVADNRFLASLFAAHVDGYRSALQATRDILAPALASERARIDRALERMPSFVPTERFDLASLDFRLFPD